MRAELSSAQRPCSPAPRRGDDADFGAGGGGGDAVELTHGEEEQVRRHARRGLETDDAAAVRARLAPRLGHVADRPLPHGHDDGEIVGRAEIGLVPARHEAPRVRRLELGEERAALARLGRVIERKQAGRLGVDDARIIDVQPVPARRDRRIEAEAGGLRGGVQRDTGAAVAVKRHRREGEIGRVERDRVGRFDHLDVDRDAARETQIGGVGGGGDRVMQRPDVAWKLARNLCRCWSGGRRNRGGALGRIAGPEGERERERGGGQQQGRAHRDILNLEPDRAMRRGVATVKRSSTHQYPKPAAPRWPLRTCARRSFALHVSCTPASACLTRSTTAAFTGAGLPTLRASFTTSPLR